MGSRIISVVRTVAIAAVGVAMTASQTGCILFAAAAGTGATVAYVKGDLDTVMPADPQKVAAATKAAFDEMKIATVENASSGIDGKLVGRTAADVKVAVDIRAQGAATSKVTIRVGTFGDDTLQHAIADEIQAHLGAGGSTAVAKSPATQPTPPAASAN